MLTPSHRQGVVAPRLAVTCAVAGDRWTVVAGRASDTPPLLGRPLVPGEDLVAACSALMAPGDRAVLAALLRDVAEGSAGGALLRLVVGGEARQVRVSAVSAPDRDRVSVALVDVTDTPESAAPAPPRRAPDLARALERIGVVAFDTRFTERSFEAVYASPGLRELLGRDFDLRDAHDVYFESIHPDDRARVLRRAEAVRTGSPRPPIEHRIVRPDGAIRWIKVADHPTMETGGTTRVSGSIIDVTDVHDARALRTLAAEAFDTHPVIVVVRDDGTFAVEGPAVAEWTRIAGDPTDPASAAALLAREAVEADGLVERTCPDRDGGGARIVAARRMGRTREGHRIAVVLRRGGQAGDWTAWRQVLERLDGAVMISVLEPDGRHRVEYANPGVTGVLGRPLPSDPYEAFEAVRGAVHPSDRPAVAGAFERLARGDGDGEVVYRVVPPDGRVRWVRHRAAVLGSGPDGTRLVTVGTDVARERRREERVRALLAGTGGVVYEHVRSPQGETRLVLPERDGVGLLQRSLPSDPRRIPDVWRGAVHADDRPRYSRWDAGDADGDISIEYRLARPNGSLVWVRDTRVPTGEGRSLGVVTELTRERLAAPDAPARPSGEAAVVAEVVASIGEAVYEIRIAPGRPATTNYVSPPFWRLLGREPTLDEEPLALWHRAVHPDDAGRARTHCDAVARGVPQLTELRVVRADGGVRWVRHAARPRMAGDGSVIVAGTLSDVTGARTPPPPATTGDGGDPAPAPPAGCPLTDRQLAVLRLVAQGAGTEEVAALLGIRAVTVNNHVAGALRRLDARSRLEAVAKARRAGYIP